MVSTDTARDSEDCRDRSEMMETEREDGDNGERTGMTDRGCGQWREDGDNEDSRERMGLVGRRKGRLGQWRGNGVTEERMGTAQTV